MRLALSVRAKMSSAQRKELERCGYEIELFEDVPHESFDVYIGYPEPLTDKERYRGASVIHLLSAGFDKLDLKDLKEKRIVLTNSRGVYDAPIAEYALYCILDYCKQGKSFRRQQEDQVWKREFPVLELSMMRIGILGTGSIGTACAERLKALGAEVTGVNRTGRKPEVFAKAYTMKELGLCLAEADAVINTLPLNPDTENVLDYRQLNYLKEGAALICVGRGKTLVETDLERVLKKKGWRSIWTYSGRSR